MISIQDSSSGIRLAGWRQGNSMAMLTPSEITDITSGENSDTYQTVKDVIYHLKSNATVDKAFQVHVSNRAELPPPEFASLTPEIATVDDDGRVRRVSDGKARILAKNISASRTIRRQVYHVEGSELWTFSSLVSNSMAQYLNDQMEEILEGKNPQTTTAIYSSMSGGNYQRNTNNFLVTAGYDLTGLSLNSPGGPRCAAISKRHVLGAKHWFPSRNFPVKFITNDNQIIERWLIEVQNVHEYPDADQTVGLLNQDLPETITPLVAPPANFLSYLPSLRQDGLGRPQLGSYRIPCVVINQYQALHTWDYCWDTTETATSAGRIGFSIPTNQQRRAFWANMIGGDSGSASFIPFAGRLMLLTAYGGNSGSTYFYYDQIQQTMNFLSTTYNAPSYTFERANFNTGGHNFPTYS